MEFEQLSEERLQAMVLSGAVENRNKMGYDRGPKHLDNPLWDILDFDLARSGVRDVDRNSVKNGDTTRVLFAPTTNLRNKGTLPADSVAVCFTFWGEATDQDKRSGTLSGIILMNKEDAAFFEGHLKQDPTLIFKLARIVNKGPIRKWDGEPAQLKSGDAITILPNDKYGGKRSESTKSKPFPDGFDPNPLF